MSRINTLFFLCFIAFGLTFSSNFILAQKKEFFSGNRCDTGSWKLVFADEFNGPTLDRSIWRSYGAKWEDQSDNWEFGRTHGNEGQIYTDTNFIFQDGILKIYTEKKLATWFTASRNHTSGFIESINSGFEYGKYEIKCRLPKGAGLWPAFWLWGGDEIDVFEADGGDSKVFTSNTHFCYGNPSCNSMQWHKVRDLSKKFHVFTVEWSPHFIKWFFDDKLVRTLSKYKLPEDLRDQCLLTAAEYEVDSLFPDQKMKIIANLALWDWSKPFDSKKRNAPTKYYFDIDYIRVYQKTPQSDLFDLCAKRQLVGPEKIIEDSEYTYSLEGLGSKVSSWQVSKNLIVIRKDEKSITVKPKYIQNLKDRDIGYVQLALVDPQPCSPKLLKKYFKIQFLM